MDNRKRIVNLESFMDMLHIYPRLPGQSFVEPPFKEEILTFLRFLRHSGAIRKLTNVNINKMHQPWRSFAAIINKCLTGKSSGYDSLRLSQVQIIWGLYHKRNVDFAYLTWKDFVFQIEHKETKKSNVMYYPRFTKVITHHFMSKDPSIPRRNKFGALLPIELTNKDIRNSNAYKEYYAVATGATPPKPKASVRKTRSSSDTTITPLNTDAGPRLTTSEKGKQAAKASKAKSLSAISEGAMTEAQHLKLATKRSLQQTHISQASGSGVDEGTGDDDEGKDGDCNDEGNNGDDGEEGGDDEQASDEEEFIHPSLSTHTEEETRDEESFDPIPKTPEDIDDEGNGEENIGINVRRGEGHDEEEEEDELYRDVNINQGRENDEFLKTINENMQKIIKEQVKEQVKALVEEYESDKIILDTYGDTVTLKRRRDDDTDKDEEPSAGSDRGSKRRREGNEPEAASATKEKATRSAGKLTQGSKSRQTSASESATAEEPMQTNFEMEEPSHLEFETGADDQPIISELAKQSDSRYSFNELMDTPVDFYNFLMNRLKVDTLTSKLLAGPTYELMKGSCKSLVELEFFLEGVYKATTDQLDWINPEGQQYPHNLLKPLPLIPDSRGRCVIPFDHFINNDLEYLRGGASSCKYTTSFTKTKAADYGHIKWIEDLVPRTMWIQEPGGYDKHTLWGISHSGHKCQQFYGFAVNQESARDVYSKRRIITVTELKIVEWHNYKHLDWITVRRDDDKLYKFKDWLRIQDIEDMLLLLNKDKKNRLMRIDELHKFNDGTLNDVRTALDDRRKGIRMNYLPHSIWRKSDKDRVAAMIQAIDKMLKTKRIMRSLERFVGGRQYEGDFRMLQRTI
nr:hypothetical protein [Tanacetum cinerariifolium]